MVYINYSSAPYPDLIAGNIQPQQNCVLPLPPTMAPQASFHGVPSTASMHLGEPGRNETLFMQTIGTAGHSGNPVNNTQLVVLNDQNTSLLSLQNQGLALSLGTQVPGPLYQHRSGSSDVSFLSPHQTAANIGSNHSALANFVPNSKYLKAAQELLEEVVNVREALKPKTDKSRSHNSTGTDGASNSEDKPCNTRDTSTNTSPELSPSERQELQNKVTKLLAMLDEVDRRYKQYYHQMQIVVSAFDVVAGSGAAKPYTTLALQTISCHFRSMRDAISSQIQATRKTLGEQDSSTKFGGIARLRYIDQQVRQQRAMQQFSIMHQHAWRPQRGLPELSVSILRAWLFEHFLHPYPKDSEKLMLARQTGLTRGQVANWFINARVRLWKPMIEDMYKEEFGEAGIDSNSSSENPPKPRDEIGSPDEPEVLRSPSTERNHAGQFSSFSPSNALATMDAATGGASADFQNVASSSNAYIGFRLNNRRPNDGDNSLLHDDGNGRFMAYQMADLGHYEGSGVSLTLGLQQNLLPMQGGIYSMAGPVGASTADFDCVSTEDRQRFGSSQLLHDFVA